MAKKTIGLLFDSVSDNTGDIAIGVALRQQFLKRGAETEIISPFSENLAKYASLVVGGGELLRKKGDEFYDVFRLEGAHILNGIGLQSADGLDYLRGYKFISARSATEASIIKKQIPKSKVRVVPCVTTLLSSDKYDIEGVLEDELLVGIHLVPEVLSICPDIVKIVNSIPYKKVFIPFTHYNYDDSFMAALPFDMTNAVRLGRLSPLQLHSVIGQMKYTITSSLHATIFAYSQNIPFVTLKQQKVRNYLKDRGLEKYSYSTQDELLTLIKRVDTDPENMEDLIMKDKKIVNEMLDEFVDLTVDISKVKPVGSKLRKQDKLQRLKFDQLESVVANRDVLIHNMVYQSIRDKDKMTKDFLDKFHQQQETIAHLNTRLRKLEMINPVIFSKRAYSKVRRILH